jgi:hypothetical protein
VTELSWSLSGGADCIRLTGLPADADVQVRPGTAVARGGLPPMAGRLVHDGASLCFVPRFAFLDGTAYTVTVDGGTAAVLTPALRLVLGADERGLRRPAHTAGRR